MGSKGGKLHAHTAGGTIQATVPKGATKGPLQIAVTKGRNGTVKRDLPSTLRNHQILAAFGIELKHGASTTRTSKPILVVFRDKKLVKGDIVVIYNAKTGKFSKTRVKVRKGTVQIRLKAGESIGVLAPKSAKKPKHKK